MTVSEHEGELFDYLLKQHNRILGLFYTTQTATSLMSGKVFSTSQCVVCQTQYDENARMSDCIRSHFAVANQHAVVAVLTHNPLSGRKYITSTKPQTEAAITVNSTFKHAPHFAMYLDASTTGSKFKTQCYDEVVCSSKLVETARGQQSQSNDDLNIYFMREET